MNKFYLLLIFSIVIGQPKKNEDVLKNIQKNAISFNKKESKDLEKKFAQAKSLERSGLYDEAFTLFKTINQDKPGIKKFFQPIKNYLKQTEEWDILLIYTKDYARARNHDFQSQLELLNIYINKIITILPWQKFSTFPSTSIMSVKVNCIVDGNYFLIIE